MIRAFILGWREADGDLGMTWGDRRDNAYDRGRHLHRQTWAARAAAHAAVTTYREEL